jgi:hypothetical protein
MQSDSNCTKSDREIGKFLSQKSVGEPGKIGWTAWQNWSDVTKIGSATVRVNVRLHQTSHGGQGKYSSDCRMTVSCRCWHIWHSSH